MGTWKGLTPTAKQMSFRKLRIAWSVTWGIVVLLLVFLCVRSYSGADVLVQSGKGGQTAVASTFGEFNFKHVYQSAFGDGSWPFWRMKHFNWNWRYNPGKSKLSRAESDLDHFAIVVSTWFCVLLSGVATMLSCPWFPFRRFSPSHSSHRHHARCRGAGADRVDGKKLNGYFLKERTQSATCI
jgi:hypothetical protein